MKDLLLVVTISNLKIPPDRLADYENEMYLNASRNIFLLLTIHIIYLFMALSLTNLLSFLMLTFKSMNQVCWIFVQISTSYARGDHQRTNGIVPYFPITIRALSQLKKGAQEMVIIVLQLQSYTRQIICGTKLIHTHRNTRAAHLKFLQFFLQFQDGRIS